MSPVKAWWTYSEARTHVLEILRAVAADGERRFVRDRADQPMATFRRHPPRTGVPPLAVSAEVLKYDWATIMPLVELGIAFSVTLKSSHRRVLLRRYDRREDRRDKYLVEWRAHLVREANVKAGETVARLVEQLSGELDLRGHEEVIRDIFAGGMREFSSSVTRGIWRRHNGFAADAQRRQPAAKTAAV